MDRPKKPSALSATPGLAPHAQINTTHSNSRVSAVLPTGESVEILLYGATIISWKDAAGTEKLWLSEKAVLDGTKAVRGGIPLVFPVFGKVEGEEGKAKGVDALPQHGFARNCRWEFLGKSTSESSTVKGQEGGDSSVKLDFGLSASNVPEETRKLWGGEFGLIYSVTLSREGLGTSMVVRNEGSTAWEFQILMHTYLKIQVCLFTLISPQTTSYANVRSTTGHLPNLHHRSRECYICRQTHRTNFHKYRSH